jgi:hypothetical protein
VRYPLLNDKPGNKRDKEHPYEEHHQTDSQWFVSITERIVTFDFFIPIIFSHRSSLSIFFMVMIAFSSVPAVAINIKSLFRLTEYH